MNKIKKINPPLCACGCGKQVNWNKSYNKWRKFLRGHQNKGKNNGMYGRPAPNNGKSKYKNEKEKPAPLCACGCGGKVNWNRTKWNKYIFGHKVKGKNNPLYGRDKYKIEKEKTAPFCACGCKEKVKWNGKEWSKYIPGHNTLGRKVSKETCKKLSNRLKGRKATDEARKNMSIAQTGRKPVSDETRRKLSIANSGKKRSKVSCRNISLGLMGKYVGPLASNWRGGVSKDPYCDIWKDREYKKDLRARDGHKCQNPECWGNCNHLPLHIHHINYNKEDCNPWNLITVCMGCNSRANTNMKYWENLYQGIMTKKYGYKYDIQDSIQSRSQT